MQIGERPREFACGRSLLGRSAEGRMDSEISHACDLMLPPRWPVRVSQPVAARWPPRCQGSAKWKRCLLRQPPCKVRVVAGALAADADVLALGQAGLDGLVDQHFDSRVALVEVPAPAVPGPSHDPDPG